MDITLTLSNSEYKDLKSYCDLNKLPINDIILKSFKEGFRIEKYGLLSGGQVVEKEVIKYVEVPKIEEKIVEIIKEVPVIQERIVEVVKEIEKPIEVYIEKESISENDSKLKDKVLMLQSTLNKLRSENIEQNKKIIELEKIIEGGRSSENKQAVFLSGSNLDRVLKK